MELECDLSAIQNEDMLRRMWQQAEDIDHKKEIRSHLYKLRESRLRDLYQGDIMAGNFAKDPLNSSHGDSLVGQNFQSLKSKEVRDSVSPTRDLKFHSMTLNHPNTTGWDVQTSSEVSPDGRAYRTETLATTDGVEKINGGTAEFRGRNEQRASASHQGDDKNFVKKASESSNTHLQEHVVVGDENSGRTEMKTSSTTTSSSSQVTSSSSTVEYGGGEPIDAARHLVDNTNRQHSDQQHHQRLTHEQYIQQQQQRQQQLQQQEFEQTKQYQQQQHEQRIQQQEQRQYSEEINRSRQESSTNVETQQKTEKNRRIVDVDKASPEYQQHVQYLMSQPGEIISNTVEYPKPNVKMITTVKRLPDGTIVKNKRYETEELQPTVESQRQRTTSTTSQSSTQHKSQQQRREQTEDNINTRQQNVRNVAQPSSTPRRPEQDVVDNAEPYAQLPNQQNLVESHASDEATNVETKFSSVKKSSRRFSTETTSETIEEFSDQPPSMHAPGIRGKPSSHSPTRDFSTHGFPSVKPNRTTQEYPTERPHGAPQSQTPDFSTHGFPSVRPNKPTQEYPSERPRPSDVESLTQHQSGSQMPHGFPAVRPNSNIKTTKDGDVIIVSSESTRSSKYKTNAERVIETEVVVDGDISGRPQKLTHPVSTSHPSHGFPAVKETLPGGRDAQRYGAPTGEYPSSPRRSQPAEDFTTHGFPSVRSPTKQSPDFSSNGFPAAKLNSAQPVTSRTVNQDGNVTVVSSETKNTIKHNTNREHVIETEILGESDRHYSPAGLRQPDKITFPPTPQPSDFSTHGFPSVRDSAPTTDAYRRQDTPTRDYPSSPRKPQPSEDYSTHGFPSVKDSAPARKSTPSHDYPSSPRQHHPSEDFSTHGFPSVRTPSKTAPDYSTPSGGFPSTRDTNAPKLTPTQPRSTTTQKTTTTTDSSQRLISKERDVDASHRAFAASLRCSSPVDSIDHHRSTPRSSVSSTRTFRRDGREGSHDSETSRISSGTVTHSSPSKSVGKTVVTKQTVVKTRNVNGSNETIDLTPQRHTKSPSPTKSITTTTTTRTTTTRKSPGEVPKPDNQKSKPAENTFPIINEPLTITKTHFTTNDASSLGNEVVEKPCIKKHFYKLGPSDSATNNVDEKSPYSPAPSNHINRTHPKSTSQNRDDLEDANHEEPIHNQPLSSSIIEPKQRNRSPSGPKNSNPQTICQPSQKEPSVERRTVVRESTFENTDWQNTILDSDENQIPVQGEFPKRMESPTTDDSKNGIPHRKGSPFDDADYPGKRTVFRKQPINKNQIENVTKVTAHVEKIRANVDIEDTEPNFVQKKPLNATTKPPNQPFNRKPLEKKRTQPEEKVTGESKPINISTSPTRRTSDVTTSKTTSTTFKTTRKENTQHIENDKKPNKTTKTKANDIVHSPTRKPSDSNITSKTTPTKKPQPADDLRRPEEPASVSPVDYKQLKGNWPETNCTRKIVESKIIENTRNNDTYSIEIDQPPADPARVDKKQPIEKRHLDKDYEHSPTRTTSDTSNLYTSKITVDTLKTRKSNVSPTRKPTDSKIIEPVQKKPTKIEPANSVEKQPKGTKLTKLEDSGVKHTSPEYARPAPTVNEESGPSGDEHNPTDNGPAREPILNADKPVGVSDEDDQSRMFTTTTIKKEYRDEPQPTNRIITDETRRVQELFNKIERTKITNNLNEEFIEIERQLKDKSPILNRRTEESSETASYNPDYYKPTTKKPLGPSKPTEKQKSVDESAETKAKIYEETISVYYGEQRPNEIDDNEPKSQPLGKSTKINESVHQEITDTNDSISFKQHLLSTPEKLREPYSPKSGERCEPEREKPKKRQPALVNSSDDHITQKTFEMTTTTKDIALTSADVEKSKTGEPKGRKPSKPVEGKVTPWKPENSENECSPTRKPCEQIILKTTRISHIIEGKPGSDNSPEPDESIDEPVDEKSTLDKTRRVEEIFKTTNKIKHNKNYNEEFIEIERQNKETPDGAFFSKAPEPEPVSPSFRKKGVSSRETFEDRCRQILGMESYGDTPGSYTKKPNDESDEKEPLTENIKKFEVKIEDCDDDEPSYLNDIKEAIKPLNNPKANKPKSTNISNEELVEEVECVRKEIVVPFKKSSPEGKVPTEAIHIPKLVVKTNIIDEDERITNKSTSNTIKKVRKAGKIEYAEPQESLTSESESPEKETDEESQPDTVVSEKEIKYTEVFQIEDRTEENQRLKPNKKLPVEKATSPNTSPTRKTSAPGTVSDKSPLKKSPTRQPTVSVEVKPKISEAKMSTTRLVNETKPSSRLPENPGKSGIVKKDKPISPSKTQTERIQNIDTPTTADKSHKKPNSESPSSTIKDRLRSSTRNKKPITQSDSSPEMSPTRFTERRRSSNISVHTEIIIDHSGPKSPKPADKTLEKHKFQPKKTVPEDIISSTKPFRRFPVTERKESAPVPSVSRKDKDVKMTRSTSEKIMKVTEKPVKRTEVDTSTPSPAAKTDRKPNKCFTTKTINLTTTEKLINSNDMESVIIDIQHAKSSREPSPDKIVPTPVPVHVDTGKPRYPDVVQEPEDEPRKKPLIKNIPIFEEESNEFINCHISEVKTEKISKLVDLEEDDILDNPTIEAPKSLEYPSIDRPDDDCLLSVHEKVSKFTHTAEEIKKPKTSSPFSREFDKTPKVPDNDECLLTVDEKVNKFKKTAEEVVKPITPVREIERPSLTDLDEELQKDDCNLTVSQKVNKFLSTAEKLAPTAPQRSPELVAKIERTISKQSEPEYPEDLSDDELTPFSQNHTIEIEKRRQKDILSRPTVFESTTKGNRNFEYVEKEVFTDRTVIESRNDEVVPHTRDHTTKIELKRQKDILSRPSIYDRNVKQRPESPRKPTGFCKPQKPVTTKAKQTVDTKKKINLEDIEKTESKSVSKPSSSSTNPENYRSSIKPQTSTVAVTRSRFETSDKKKPAPKSATEPKFNRVPLLSATGRKPNADPKTTLPSKSARILSTTADTKSPYSSRRKPFNEVNSEPRKQSTEPDSHYSERKPSAGSVTNVDDYETIESETEFTSTTRRRSSSKTKDYLETVQTEIERFSPTRKESIRKIASQENQKPQSFSHSPTQKDTRSTITKVARVTERTIQHSSPSDCSDIEIVETVPERPTQVKTPTSTTTITRTRIAPDTVAARRNLFENNLSSKGQRPNGSDGSPSPVGRRPSYMDHTVSSLEHIRRDSLEVNKHNYSRKSSVESESNYERRPNAAVKFDVPQKPQRTASIPEDIDVESIFELEVLERLLETVTSYELRRRIRAQIRLVKKNILNTEVVDKRKTETKTSKSISSTHKTSTYTSNEHHEETDIVHEDFQSKSPYESKPSPRRSTPITKSGRVTEIEDTPRKFPYDRNNSPTKPNGKFRREEEVSTKVTTNAKPQNGRSESPKRHTKMSHERHSSPESQSPQGSVKEVRHRTDSSMSSTHKEFMRSEQRNFSEETFNSSRLERFEKEKSRERSYSSEYKSPTRDGKQSPDYRTKPTAGTRTKSPEARKPSFQRSPSPQGRTPKRSDDLYTISKVTTVKTTRSPERKSSKPITDENTPIWADRKNLLKSPSSTPRKVPAAPSARTTATKATTKTTSQRQTQNRNFEEDSITSSYGIGPTDENGLPLFGIKALKKKKSSQPCEATEEVTGYVIEEKYYSDNKTRPKVERKEYIYSTNADELEEIKKTVEQNRKSSQDDVDVIRKFEKIDKDYVFEKPEAILPDSEEFSTSSKYVRRGSVKELSEKFIRKESSQSITEKSSGYPKAGLILRTSRAPSTEPNGDAYETTAEKHTSTSRSGHGYRSTEVDSDDEYNVQLRQKQTRRIFTEDEDNESNQCHLSTRSSTKSTRSFLNSSDESKVVTSVDDALERMRNADYVVEAGDTAEDREARSLLNKFLGASVIMSGVESVLPTTKQTTTTTITKTSYADDNGENDLLKNKAVKTTRITKTTKSGSSSTPVTRTTCDIEEIWDEEILKELLEQATTYEERRKIRARLRDLMAEREEKTNFNSGELSENASEADESSASEYEEIVEEVTVTDYSDAEADLGEEDELNTPRESKAAETKTVENEKEAKEASIKKYIKLDKEVTKAEVKESVSQIQVAIKSEAKSAVEEAASSDSKVSNSAEECEVQTSADKTDSISASEGESLVPLLQGILQKSLPKPKENANSQKNHEKAPNTAADKVAETSTHTNKACSSSSESSDLCTVSKCNKNCNVSHNDQTNINNSNLKNNNTHTDSNIQTHSDKKDCTNTNTNQSLDLKQSQATMTRDIVMNSTTKDGNSGNRSSDNVSKLDRLAVPQKEDSGTESGEDLRLIAAGLRDSLQLQSDTNLIEEVTAALTRLELSLKEGKDIPVDGSKREALLALVARLQTGLNSPDAALSLSNMANSAGAYDETSSPEADGQRSNRQRFARRRNRNSRHTVGVSREELADARRYMEDMQLMENISNCTTPESGLTGNPATPPQWFPIEKNPSSGAILTGNSSSTLYRPNQFVPAQLKNTTTCLNNEKQTTERENDRQSKRPLSGNYSVSFGTSSDKNALQTQPTASHEESSMPQVNGYDSPDSSLKSSRFSNKKQLMKRANTIDIPKSKKYNPDFDTDSEPEEKAPQLGLKRTLQVNVKEKVRSVIPPFVPKTENDHKFLAFINKQSAKPGLGWTGSRSVSNWTNKFGNLKHTFEVGAAAQVTTGKPPQAPGHVPHSAAKNYWQKQVAAQDYHLQQQQQQYLQYQQQQQQQQQLLQRTQQEANERQHRQERERHERERIERDRLERQRLERERQERDRIEREYYERGIMERERLAAAQHAAMPSMSVPKPAPVNKFQHAPQSVFRPIDNIDSHNHNIFKPIPQLPQKLNTWQPPSISNKPLSAPAQISPVSPQFQYLNTKQSINGTQVTSPSSTASSPIGLPWVAKPAVDNSDFRKKAHTFEERSQNDNRQNSYLQRHHSLRSPKVSLQPMDEYKKRPSLPSTADPYMAAQSQYIPSQSSNVYGSTSDVYVPPPPPTNVSFSYADLARNSNYKSYPCLPSAVETSITADYVRQRESSLTDPNATPLVLTSSNPTYQPPVDTRAYYNNISAAKQFDYVSPMDSAPTSPSVLAMQQSDYTDDDLDSDNLMEYRAETRVMGKPQSQTAVTIRDRRTAHASDDEVFGKNSRNAQNLLHTMRNIGKNGSGGAKVRNEVTRKVESPKVCLSPDGRAYQAPIVEPLFPQLSKFEPNRTPEYIESTIKTPTQANPKKSRPKTPPMPSQQIDRSLQLARAEEKYRVEHQKYVEKTNTTNGNNTRKQEQQIQYQTVSSVSSAPSTNSLPYVSEAPTAYVVTYPTDDIYKNEYGKQHPTSLPLQRNRNVSENSSASSSVSHNMPSPGTNWTPNPIHSVVSSQHKSQNSTSTNIESQNIYQTQTQPPATAPALLQNCNNVQSVSPSRPSVASKSTTTISALVPPPISQPTYQQPYTQPTNQPLVTPQSQSKLPQQSPVQAPSPQVKEQQATSTTEKTETKDKDGAVVTTTTKVTTRTVTGAGGSASKPASPFAKFRQLDKQNSQQSPKSPSTPTTPGGTASPSGSARIFQFTDPALNARAATVKEQLLQWCQSKTQEYENVQITNFSASWSDGLAFCALIHHFLPDAFDYSTLTPKSRRHNFELAFTVADEKAGIAPLLDVEDMVEMKRPDWKCVFIYVQSIYRRFRNCQ